MEAFGIDLKILIAQVINFCIVLFVLAKFAYKPILGVLDERSKKIANGLEDAEKAKTSLEKAEEDAALIYEQAYAKGKKIVSESEKEAVEKAKAIIAKAEAQAEKIVSNAQTEADLAKNSALGEAKNRLGELISLSLEKIVGKSIGSSEREKLTASAIEEL